MAGLVNPMIQGLVSLQRPLVTAAQVALLVELVHEVRVDRKAVPAECRRGLEGLWAVLAGVDKDVVVGAGHVLVVLGILLNCEENKAD